MKDLPITPRINHLYERVSKHIDTARESVQRSVNQQMLIAYWNIGKDIVEEEQTGDRRGKYGEQVIKNLSERLVKKYGKGFGIRTLEYARKFYFSYGLESKERKAHALRAELIPPEFSMNLGWTHYRILMKEKREAARKFYEKEASQNNWSTRELESGPPPRIRSRNKFVNELI